MSPEYALYLQLMLHAGVTDPFDQWFERALAQDSYEDPLLDILRRPSDPDWVSRALGAYIGRFPKPDGRIVCSMVRETLWAMRRQGTPPARLCELMYILSELFEADFPDDQLNSMHTLPLLLDDVKNGFIDREAFLQVLDDFLQNGTSVFCKS